MRITVLYFASLRELTGLSSAECDLPASVLTIADLSAYLQDSVPELRGRLESVRIARNESFAAADESLAAGDVIALIPPVAGG